MTAEKILAALPICPWRNGLVYKGVSQWNWRTLCILCLLKQ